MKLYDISITITPEMPFWPKDKPFSLNQTQRGHVCISEIIMGLHTGTHLDAPYHFLPDGNKLDDIPLDRFMGQVRVCAISDPISIKATELLTKNLSDLDKILFKTENSNRWKSGKFDQEFIGLALDGAEYLVKNGIKLVGIDYLSIEAFGSDGGVHRTLMGNDILILEGLDLSSVPDGDYYLICYPLKLAKVEGSPTRAVLLSETIFDS